MFKIKIFRNSHRAIIYRVDGRLRGVRIRRNFKSRADAEAEARLLDVQQRADANEFRTVITWLTPAQLREAEAVFHRLRSED